MDQIKKTFLGNVAACGAFAAAGVASMIAMQEVSLATSFPILGAAYFGVVAYLKYKESKSKQIVEYTTRLISVEKSDMHLSEDYHFETVDGEATEIFITGLPRLTDDSGKKLKKGYLYTLVYLTDNGKVSDFNSPFTIVPVRGLSKSLKKEADHVLPDSED